MIIEPGPAGVLPLAEQRARPSEKRGPGSGLQDHPVAPLTRISVTPLKLQANLQEGRHALARKIFHGKYGQLYQDGMEDQIGALGLVLNARVLFSTRYMDAAVTQLRNDGFDVRDEDVARLSPFVRHHINMLGRYSFSPPDSPGACGRCATRTLRRSSRTGGGRGLRARHQRRGQLSLFRAVSWKSRAVCM